jgi:hypothetical protein
MQCPFVLLLYSYVGWWQLAHNCTGLQEGKTNLHAERFCIFTKTNTFLSSLHKRYKYTVSGNGFTSCMLKHVVRIVTTTLLTVTPLNSCISRRYITHQKNLFIRSVFPTLSTCPAHRSLLYFFPSNDSIQRWLYGLSSLTYLHAQPIVAYYISSLAVTVYRRDYTLSSLTYLHAQPIVAYYISSLAVTVYRGD